MIFFLCTYVSADDNKILINKIESMCGQIFYLEYKYFLNKDLFVSDILSNITIYVDINIIERKLYVIINPRSNNINVADEGRYSSPLVRRISNQDIAVVRVSFDDIYSMLNELPYHLDNPIKDFKEFRYHYDSLYIKVIDHTFYIDTKSKFSRIDGRNIYTKNYIESDFIELKIDAFY